MAWFDLPTMEDEEGMERDSDVSIVAQFRERKGDLNREFGEFVGN